MREFYEKIVMVSEPDSQYYNSKKITFQDKKTFDFAKYDAIIGFVDGCVIKELGKPY